MAFTTATGYGNLPNGNFSPVIYSKQVQLAFRKSAVAEAITNSDYFGEITQMGDSVKIIKEPEITVKAYARGSVITPQDLDDEDFTLTIDKANYYAFKVDDIEEAHSHINFQQLASDRAAYRLADQFDQDVLGYMSGYKQSAIHGTPNAVNDVTNGTVSVATAGTDELLSSMKIDALSFGGSSGDALALQPRTGGATDSTPAAGDTFPLTVIARMSRLLDQQNVDSNGRWLVALCTPLIIYLHLVQVLPLLARTLQPTLV